MDEHAVSLHTAAAARPKLSAHSAAGLTTLHVAGRLDAVSVGALWVQGGALLAQHATPRAVLDAREVTYCDAAGAAWLVQLRRAQQQRGGEFEIEGLSPDLERVVAILMKIAEDVATPPPLTPVFIAEDVGEEAVRFYEQTRAGIPFMGELVLALGAAAIRPLRVRWGEVLHTIEKAGSNALPLVAMIGSLFGLILAFQSAIPLRRFGAEIYIADMVALSMVRELAAILTAIVFAGRSGSAFAAEIGTMKVNEELDALRTMGLDATSFLVVPRVIAGAIVTPLLSLVMILSGLVGCWIVLRTLGYSTAIFEYRVLHSVTFGGFNGGLFKATVFGLEVAAIGCFQGLRTGKGASGVGASTTSAVVASIVIMTVTDGLFAVLFYIFDI